MTLTLVVHVSNLHPTVFGHYHLRGERDAPSIQHIVDAIIDAAYLIHSAGEGYLLDPNTLVGSDNADDAMAWRDQWMAYPFMTNDDLAVVTAFVQLRNAELKLHNLDIKVEYR